ncbi:MAG: iron-containing alcohol dehydrogenase [Anaerocolumna sp.]|nr:iron-containing alcohol dehydrogenase [Anaerocolumna sp.]
MAYEFRLPKRSILGAGAIKLSENLMKTYGKKAFIVCGKVTTKMGIVKILTDSLTDFGIDYKIFNEPDQKPPNLLL